MEIKVRVLSCLKKETGEGNNGTWERQTLIGETLGEYPKKIAFQAFGEKTALFASLKKGEIVTIGVNIESREYNEKWYTNINAWKITKGNEVAASAPVEVVNESTEEEEDLPF